MVQEAAKQESAYVRPPPRASRGQERRCSREEPRSVASHLQTELYNSQLHGRAEYAQMKTTHLYHLTPKLIEVSRPGLDLDFRHPARLTPSLVLRVSSGCESFRRVLAAGDLSGERGASRREVARSSDTLRARWLPHIPHSGTATPRFVPSNHTRAACQGVFHGSYPRQGSGSTRLVSVSSEAERRGEKTAGTSVPPPLPESLDETSNFCRRIKPPDPPGLRHPRERDVGVSVLSGTSAPGFCVRHGRMNPV